MQASHDTSYMLDTAVTQHGLHVAGTTAEWAAEIATPLRGNSNVALSLSTFFAAPLLRHAMMFKENPAKGRGNRLRHCERNPRSPREKHWAVAGDAARLRAPVNRTGHAGSKRFDPFNRQGASRAEAIIFAAVRRRRFQTANR
jgi:hypothetical protein